MVGWPARFRLRRLAAPTRPSDLPPERGEEPFAPPYLLCRAI
jgi:hypothetical protein